MAQKTKIVLFSYGGGMRGIVPASLMHYMEERTGLRMADMVDIFCGPSTGAILNAALNVPHPHKPGQPKYKARHLIKFYEREGKNIFPSDRLRDFRALIHDFNNRTMRISKLRKIMRLGHYDPAVLRRCLKLLYGDTTLDQSLKSLVISTYNIEGATLAPLVDEGETDDTPVHTINNFLDEGGQAVWLKHIKPGFTHIKPTPDVPLFDAVMGTTAAPTYFPCHHLNVDFRDGKPARTLSGIDGSLFDNPCIAYHGAVRQHIPADTRTIMIVLGTGYAAPSITKDDWNSYGNIGVVDPANDLPLINILFHAPESALLGSFHDSLGDDLYVFNKSLITCDSAHKPSRQIDDATPENLKALKAFSAAMIEEQHKRLDQLCDILVTTYETNQREAFAKGKDQRRWFSFFSK